MIWFQFVLDIVQAVTAVASLGLAVIVCRKSRKDHED